MHLLDTDVLIDIQRDYEPALAWFESLEELPGVPGFVVMELIQKADSARQVEEAMRLVAPFEIVWPSDLDCDLALQHRRRRHTRSLLRKRNTASGAKGRPI
ncbi:MAG: PIN domain-containing protein [Acidobacteriota bacterium]